MCGALGVAGVAQCVVYVAVRRMHSYPAAPVRSTPPARMSTAEFMVVFGLHVIYSALWLEHVTSSISVRRAPMNEWVSVRLAAGLVRGAPNVGGSSLLRRDAVSSLVGVVVHGVW